MPIVSIVPSMRVTVAWPAISCIVPMGEASFVLEEASAYSLSPRTNESMRSSVNLMPLGAINWGAGSALKYASMTTVPLSVSKIKSAPSRMTFASVTSATFGKSTLLSALICNMLF